MIDEYKVASKKRLGAAFIFLYVIIIPLYEYKLINEKRQFIMRERGIIYAKLQG